MSIASLGWAVVPLINYQSRNLDTAIASIPRLAEVAHELRTPLQVVLGYLEILREECADGLGAEPRRILDRMNLNAHRLALTVENLMEFAFGDSSTPCPDEDISISRLLSELKPSFYAALEGKRLSIVFQLADAPSKMRSQRRPFRLILQNLVLNAIKSASNGPVIVAVRRCGEMNLQPSGVEIEVSYPECRSRIAPDAPSRRPAADLGLSVVGRSAETLGATVEMRRVSGAAPSIVVRIPAA
jgi:light-regulated signal transduction histidine kinase (bacteriophytochrome)